MLTAKPHDVGFAVAILSPARQKEKERVRPCKDLPGIGSVSFFLKKFTPKEAKTRK
jgi:hypothetical protein